MSKRIIRLRISLFLVCFLMFIWIEQALAMDKTQLGAENPLEIYSKTAEFDDQKRTATYKIAVMMNQGNHHLTSDILIILRDTNGKIESMIATGNPAHFYTTSSLEKSELQGHAKIIEFYPKQDKLLFLQNAELTQNNETIRSEKLTYFLSTHVLLSNPVFGKKTTILLMPKSPSPNVLPTGNHTP
ncbi:MAG TPA: lipopolysaccharide transport periplasmic protein LptA [Gammaproteobacteria bacterium]|nr:lipopolysaccharide transport periplasmic protein LptA [Gammaproteobacteria bacterium]